MCTQVEFDGTSHPLAALALLQNTAALQSAFVTWQVYVGIEYDTQAAVVRRWGGMGQNWLLFE